jgi:uncharacterized DUF497 family protein
VSPSFEWDPAKDAQNQRKHGVAFADARLAFLDPARVIAKDLSHSKGEISRTARASHGSIASVRLVAVCRPYALPTVVT